MIRGAATASFADLLRGARCWGLELEPRYRVLAVTVEIDGRMEGLTMGEQQLLCFPVSTLIVTVTRPLSDGQTAVVTFDLEDLTKVSQRFGGLVVGGELFGRPEPRPGTWAPRPSLEGRSSASDGTRRTVTIDLDDEDGSRLRCFARFDELELRDASGTLLRSTAVGDGPGSRDQPDGGGAPVSPLRFS